MKMLLNCIVDITNEKKFKSLQSSMTTLQLYHYDYKLLIRFLSFLHPSFYLRPLIKHARPSLIWLTMERESKISHLAGKNRTAISSPVNPAWAK